MLRIDETSKTLVAPQQAAFVAEAPPGRDEMLALLSSGWQAFAAEIGQPHLRFLAAAPEPGVDVLAFDEAAGRVAVVQVSAGEPREAFASALLAAAEVASWDAQDLAEVHEDLQAAVPGDSPRVILVGSGWSDEVVATVDWLVRRHGVEMSAYSIQTLRFGSERLMQVARAYPAPEAAAPAADPAAFFAQVGSAAPPVPGQASAPPPGVPAA